MKQSDSLKRIKAPLCDVEKHEADGALFDEFSVAIDVQGTKSRTQFSIWGFMVICSNGIAETGRDQD